MWDTSGGPGAARGAAGPASFFRPAVSPFPEPPGRAGAGAGAAAPSPASLPAGLGQRRCRRAGRALPCPAAAAAPRGLSVLHRCVGRQRAAREPAPAAREAGGDGEQGECCWRREPSPREGCPGLSLPAGTEPLGFSGVFLAWFGFASLHPQLWFCVKPQAQLSQPTKTRPKLCAVGGGTSFK